jgi:gas vesicle protein GvpG
VGVIKGLLLLPLAPVRGTVWVAEQLAAEAERQLDPRAVRQRSLLELEARRLEGEIGDEEYDRLEEEILLATTTTSGGTSNGGLEQEDDASEAEWIAVPVGQRRREALDERKHPQSGDEQPEDEQP